MRSSSLAAVSRLLPLCTAVLVAIDFYSAVRHAYLERRRNLIKE